MKPDHFLALYRELIDENPFAVRAVLRILEVTFTDSIPTLAVSCEAQPRFLVNPDFVATHCKTESHVKAVIVHEFLHVLLRHTESSGPLNGQTGRKLVADYYGPRIPIGGGALFGKHWTHIDRIGARAGRRAAIEAVQSGAQECLLRIAYAPGIDSPLDVVTEMIGRGTAPKPSSFAHSSLRDRLLPEDVYRPLAHL